MSAPALAGPSRPTVHIRGRAYPVLLPTLRDPRLHLAAVIVSLQVLGQVAFHFRLSIAQILVALLTCAVLEMGIAFRRQHVILWPASALLTGNGVAFILRVPGTEHGDWWSLHGAWIFAATAAVGLLSKYLIRIRGRHLFNPSNFGLVLCFLLLGSDRVDPLEFWWGPMSPWLALALAIIVAGGLGILLRLRILGIAVGFWLSFAGCLAVVALSGHAMTARWHLGPISDGYFWRVLVFSPEILVFLFFMITDPKTIPEGATARRVYAVAVGVLAVLLIAPQTTEFGSKVALLVALALVCAARPLIEWLFPAERSMDTLSGEGTGVPVFRRAFASPARTAVAATALAGIAVTLVLAGIPARSNAMASSPPGTMSADLPDVTVARSEGVATLGLPTARRIVGDLVADLGYEADALQRRDTQRAAAGADGSRLVGLWRQINSDGQSAVRVPLYRATRARVTLEPGAGQGQPSIVAVLTGTVVFSTSSGSPPKVESRSAPQRFEQTFELRLKAGRYLIVGSRNASPPGLVTPVAPPGSGFASVHRAFGGVHLRDVAQQVGLDFRQGAFRFGVTSDPPAMMGGGLCWLDYNNDGWLDLFVVNSYSDLDLPQWEEHGGIPRSALFENRNGRFVNVTDRAHAGLAVRGEGCVAADFNGDGHTDLYVTTAVNDQLLWNNGDGTFTEGARAAGIHAFGWHSSAAVADVNGDGRPDLFVAGYTDMNAPIAGSDAGFPTNHKGWPDLLYLNEGVDTRGRSRFREVGMEAGLGPGRLDHSLGAEFTDFDHDGRPDLYVANDEDPNRLYMNVPWPGGAKADPTGLGFRFEERAAAEGVADGNAGMGVAAADYTDDGSADLFVTNSRGQTHAVFRSRSTAKAGSAFADARAGFASALGTSFAGWGASWVDLDRDGNLDLILTNGDIPVTNLAKDAQPIQVLQNLAGEGRPGRFAQASGVIDKRTLPLIVGRGLAAADYDNDGNVDIAINTIGGPLVLLRNTGSGGHWLEVSVQGFHPGATVTAVLPGGRRLYREVAAGSSYLSSEDPRVHFGLGPATTVRELVVRFPNGGETRITDVAADKLIVVKPAS